MPSRVPGTIPVAKKHPRSFRFSDEAERILEELGATMGLTRTAIIEQALRLLYRRESGRKNPPKKQGDSA